MHKSTYIAVMTTVATASPANPPTARPRFQPENSPEMTAATPSAQSFQGPATLARRRFSKYAASFLAYATDSSGGWLNPRSPSPRDPTRRPTKPELTCYAVGMDVAVIRKRMHLTQAGLGRLVGAHAMTVSKWERGVLKPAAFQRSILAALEASATGRESPDGPRPLGAAQPGRSSKCTEVDGMNLSASNQFKGKVTHLEEGPVTTRVVIEIAPRVQITSLITTASVRRLGLRVGK